jgi:hypothetical protein
MFCPLESLASVPIVGFTYEVTEIEKKGVIVCIRQGYSKGDFRCPNQTTLLRQNVKTGEVVQFLNPVCAKSGNGRDCFLDDCVASGQYRYGLATPQECVSLSHNHPYISMYYGELKLESSIKTCSSKPVVFKGNLSWSDNRIYCRTGCFCSTLENHASALSQGFLFWILTLLWLVILRMKHRTVL